MLQYKNHRFHLAGISFQIPEGFFFDSCPEVESENTIRLYAPEEAFALALRVEEDCLGSERELASIIHDMEPTLIQPIAPLTVNGLQGHHATYRSRRTQYYEAWLDIGKGSALSLIIETRGDILDIDTAAVLTAVDPRLQNGT